MRRLLGIVGLAACLAAPAARANTRFGFGTIVDVDTDGKATEGGYFLYSKGFRIGRVTAQDLTLDGSRLKGTFTGMLKQLGETPVTVTIDAQVLGNRLVSGQCTISAGEQTVAMTARGGVCSADGPQIEAATPEQKIQVKKMQAAIAE